MKNDPVDGTPVAKHEFDVNATLSTPEKETDAAPLTERGNDAFARGTTANRLTKSNGPSGETLFGVAGVKATEVGTNAVPVAVTPTPEPTATRQVAKVETLLKHALDAGESVRPNGGNQLEMRVRLDGGNHDVTVRLQVANDRLQVTFQTNSPELRKALEHGWEQFSADAAQSSTLAMSKPRFETTRVDSTQQNAPTDNRSFSTGQQNSRRQEKAALPADESTPGAPSQRTGNPATASQLSSAGPAIVRRWSGWA